MSSPRRSDVSDRSVEEFRPVKLRVANSPRHGRGVYAVAPIRKGTRIIEYEGKRVSWAWASRKYPEVDGEPTHTFLFELEDDMVIDANQDGNDARWINHSCDPNCQAVDEEGRIYIEAMRNIAAGEELGYDYNIRLPERLTPALKKRWPCHCGSRKCRGTLLMPKRGKPTPMTRPPEQRPAKKGSAKNEAAKKGSAKTEPAKKGPAKKDSAGKSPR